MSNEYELLPTDNLSHRAAPARRRGSKASSILSALKLRHFRPAHLVYALPPLLLLIVVLDYANHGKTSIWSRLRSDSSGSLRFDDAGLAHVDRLKARGKHPILELIERGRARAEEMEVKRKSVRSLGDAVRDYRESFGMSPPEGFEGWYNFAVAHDSTPIPSLIPFTHTSVLPYLALPPLLLQQRAVEQQAERAIFGMTFRPASTNVSEQIVISNEDDVTGYMSPRWDYPLLLESIIPLLPASQQPDRPVQLTACSKDGACRLSHGGLMEMSREKARKGLVWDEEELVRLENGYIEQDVLGWPTTCPPNISAVPSSSGTSFVHDFMEYMDFCKHPELTKTNGEMIMEDQHIMRPLAPILAVSRPMHGADMMGVPTRDVNATHDFEPWDLKNRSQVVWRGTITGVFHRERYDWRSSQRDRLAVITGDVEDTEEVEVLVEEKGGVERRRYPRGELVEKWMNVGVINHDIDNMCGVGPTGEACRLDGKQTVDCMVDHACDQMKAEIHFKESMTNTEALPYKYRFDIDGYGWSSRFRKLLSSNSLIIKSTVYPEWWSARLSRSDDAMGADVQAQAIPWYHFIPMKYDYSDMFDIVSFFDGPPEVARGEGRSLRDSLAEEIAGNGRRFAMERLRWVDMQSYMYLFLLEYRRAWSLDREAATDRG